MGSCLCCISSSDEVPSPPNPEPFVHIDQPSSGGNQERPNDETVNTIVVALYDYDARTTEDLSFRTNDQMEVATQLIQSNQDWWFARLIASNKRGYIPRNFVAEVASLEAEP